MVKIYNPPKYRSSTRIAGVLIGIAVSALIFLAIPLTQIFTEHERAPEEIHSVQRATPPPPPPPEDPPPPPEPEEQEPPPELETPPPPISLEQLDMALNPGTGGALAADFALPTFEVSGQELGGIEMFDISDADKKPVPIRQVEPRARGQRGTVVLRFTVDQHGDVQDIRIHQSSNPALNRPSIDAVRQWKFSPGEKNGQKIITQNVQLPINFQ